MMYSSTEYLYTDNKSLYVQRFKSLKTLITAYFHFLLTLLLEVTVVTFLCVQFPNKKSLNLLTILLYCQTIFWVASLIFDLMYRCRHVILKQRGHFGLLKNLNYQASFMFIIPSFCNAILLITVACSDCISHMDEINHFGVSSKVLILYIVCGIISLQTLLLLPTVAVYIISVHQFNKYKPLPDIEKHEYWSPCDSRSSAEIGYRLDGEALADLLEKQADLIYYFKSTVLDLNSRLAEISQSRQNT